MSARLAGGRWRILAHEWKGRKHPEGEDGLRYGAPIELDSTRLPPSEFDELVVGRWLHVEQMDTGRWWMNVGGVTLWIQADRDGRPKNVTVYGPGTYADAVKGVDYECSWAPPAPSPGLHQTAGDDC